MTGIALAALVFCAFATLVHLITAGLAFWRIRAADRRERRPSSGSVTIIRPVCGLDYFDELTLRSTFGIDHPDVEIIFCCAREQDPAVPVIRALISAYPAVSARLLIGDDKPTANPKLNNLAKGWRSARGDWVVLADSNVLMPPGYVSELFASFLPGTGLVCSPPVGSLPKGFWAELECAFLNTYQARWQYAADTIGFGFAQGKSMLWRRADLNAVGGIAALGIEIAEDAAATKVVRDRGLRVRLVDRPFEQPLGPRRAQQVWDRQVRWARLRRATFPIFYMPEIFTGSFLPLLVGTYAAATLSYDPVVAAALLVIIWFGTEGLLARTAGWHLSVWSPAAWLLRDLLLPILWIKGLAGSNFTWRGNEMSVAGQATPPEPREAQV
jgi:ceramide glucosyltransferase